PRADCEGELNRCLLTLSMSADEARRIAGEVIPLDATPNLVNRMGYTILVPRGVVCDITPYNSPLNVVAHKVAPALAGGNVVVLKPSEYTPLTAVMLCEALIDAGLPPEHITLLHGPGASVGQALLDDPRIAFYAFTGSTRVGKMIQAAAGLRGTQLELGSIASTIVMADADLAVAAKKITAASFRKAGQVCTSVQRVLVDRTVEAEFADRVTAAVRDLSYGDPREAGTVVGPMISEDAAIRADKWVNEALQAGATCRVGGERNGNVYAPTVLTN